MKIRVVSRCTLEFHYKYSLIYIENDGLYDHYTHRATGENRARMVDLVTFWSESREVTKEHCFEY